LGNGCLAFLIHEKETWVQEGLGFFFFVANKLKWWSFDFSYSWYKHPSLGRPKFFFLLKQAWGMVAQFFSFTW
jgi:hypothetical protein